MWITTGVLKVFVGFLFVSTICLLVAIVQEADEQNNFALKYCQEHPHGIVHIGSDAYQCEYILTK